MKMDKSQYKDVYVFVEQREGVIHAGFLCNAYGPMYSLRLCVFSFLGYHIMIPVSRRFLCFCVNFSATSGICEKMPSDF